MFRSTVNLYRHHFNVNITWQYAVLLERHEFLKEPVLFFF
jgi:hypothetical protein